jgi:hypothetical protein
LDPLEGLLVNLRRGFALALVALAPLAGATVAQASEASSIIEKCAHGKPISGYSQSAYRQALKQLPTILIEYSPCPEQIRNAELAAAGGGAGGTSTGGASNVPLALTPKEQSAVQNAHHAGSTPVRVGNQPIRPGVVHANIASAVNTLPHSLFALLAFMLASLLALAIGEVVKRVRAHRNS